MSYTLGDLNDDAREVMDGLADAVSEIYAVAVRQLEEAGNVTQQMRETVWRNAVQDSLQHLRDSAINEFEQAVAEGNEIKQQVWGIRYQTYQQQMTDLLNSETNAQFFERLRANQAKFLTREMGPLPGIIFDAQDAYEAYATGDMNKFGEALSGILGSMIFTAIVAFSLAGLALAFWELSLIMIVTGMWGETTGKWLWNNQDIFSRDNFRLASNWIFRRDPLTLDLDGDGIETVGINDTDPVMFDHDGDGVAHATGWIASDDGFLVLDRNGNGTIDSGRELFGDSTQLPNGSNAEDGFAALAAEDTNGDGAVTAADARFSQLRVWRDLNQDGESQANELFTLDQLGIVSINVNGVARNQVLGNGNQIADVGTYVRNDGTQGTVGETHDTADVDLADDPFFSDFPPIPVAPEMRDLPNMHGSGAVRDLWEAATLSSDLRAVLTQFAQATTRAQQRMLLDTLVQEWAEVAGMKTMEQRADDIHAGLQWRRLGDIENPGGGFISAGDPTGGGPGGGGGFIPVTEEDFEEYDRWVATLAHTRMLFAVLEAFNGRYFFSFPGDPGTGARSGGTMITMSSDQGSTGGGGGGGSPISQPVFRIMLSQAQLDALQASYDAVLDGVYDALVVQTRMRPLIELIALEIDSSGEGIKYNFAPMHAELEQRIQANTLNGMADLIELATNLHTTLLHEGWDGLALVEQYIRTVPSTPALQELYEDTGVRIGAATGGTVTGDRDNEILIAQNVNTGLNGAAGNDILIGGTAHDTMLGGTGDDTLIGHEGNDSLEGGMGHDRLTGGAGNDSLFGDGAGGGWLGVTGSDVLVGGTGNDTLIGGFGSDTYLFARGDGQDIINNDGDPYSGSLDPLTGTKVDALVFTDIASTEVALIRSGNNLIIKVNGSSDQVLLSGYFIGDGLSSRGYAIDEIRFSDGIVWEPEDVRVLVLLPTSGNDTLTGYASDDVINGGEGNDTIDGGAGNDTLNGGAGNDEINGNAGNDTIDGGDGDDVLTGEVGDDHLIGGAGDDHLYGEINVGGYLGRLGNDILDGGAGNDTVRGGFGSDTYLFGRGDGQDILVNQGDSYASAIDPTVGKLDVLQFKDGVAPADIQLVRQGLNLIVKISGTTDQVLISNYFVDDGVNAQGYAVEQFHFADGTTWDIATVKARALLGTSGNDVLTGYATDDTINGAEGNDTIVGAGGKDTINGGTGNDEIDGSVGNDTIEGGDGNDVLTGEVGDDHLIGGAGDDHLYGEINVGGYLGRLGNDILDGGAGNDHMRGGFGSDTYLFGRGDGQDYIVNDGDSYAGAIDPTVNKIDTLQFKAGVAASDVVLSRSGLNLVIKIVGTTDQVTITDYFFNDGVSPRGYAVERIRFADGTSWDIATVKLLVQNGTEGNDVMYAHASGSNISAFGGNDTIYGAAGNDRIDGGDGSDVMYGRDGSDHLIGGAGNDTLYGENDAGGGTAGALWNDILDGGAGNDTVKGGFGSDTYLFGRGDGQDILVNQGDTYGSVVDPTVGKLDVLQFKEGVAPADIQLVRQGLNLIVKIVGTTDQVLISNYFSNDGISAQGFAVEQFRFADGTTWDIATVKARALLGTSGNDVLTGYASDDTINGADGNDTILGVAGNDTINGGAGNDEIDGGLGNDTIEGGDGVDVLTGEVGDDHLIGGAGDDHLYGEINVGGYLGRLGNDILDGGAGNDTLRGGFGSDTYLFGRGDGQDILVNQGDSYASAIDPTVGKLDVLQFKAGVLPSDILLVRSGQNLIVKISGTTDQVTISNYFVNDGIHAQGYAVEQFRFADGTTWDIATVKARALLGTSANDVITGYATDDTINGAEGNDTIVGAGGNDTINGGSGNDEIDGSAGNDTIEGGDGNDVLTGQVGDDHLIGGAGDDYLYGEINVGSHGGLLGNDILDGGAGNDQLRGGFGSDTYLFSRGDGQDIIVNDGDSYGGTIDPTANKVDVLQFEDIASTEVTLSRSGNNLVVKVAGSTDQVTINSYFISDGIHARGYAVEQIRFSNGITWDIETVKNLVLIGSASADTLTGYATNDLLRGYGGVDTINGQGGNDILQGGDGNDSISDSSGNGLFDGGAGVDTLNGGDGQEIFLGGVGNDSISTGSGPDIIAFNRGDGADFVPTATATGGGDTLSLGGALSYADMTLTKSGNNLVLGLGSGDQITLQNWYAATSNRSIVTLQVVAEAMAAFNGSGADPLLDDSVEQFNFLGLVERYDQARAATPTLTTWALSNALLEFHTGGSDTQAIGGDVAYRYGLNGNLTGVGAGAAHAVINDPQVGTAAQTLNPVGTVFSGDVRLA